MVGLVALFISMSSNPSTRWHIDNRCSLNTSDGQEYYEFFGPSITRRGCILRSDLWEQEEIIIISPENCFSYVASQDI